MTGTDSFYGVEGYRSHTSVGYLVRRAGKLVTARLEGLFAGEEMTFGQWVILMNLRDGVSQSAARLGQHLCYDSGALTRVIDQLQERGLVARRRNADDRRVLDLEITAAGLVLVNGLLPRVVDFYNGLLAKFSREDADTLVRLLGQLNGELDAPAEGQGGER